MIRVATLLDIKELLITAQEFTNESNFDWVYNEENSIKTLYNYIRSQESDILVIDDKEIKAIALVAYDTDFHADPVGYVSKFYTRKNGRGSTASRELVCACLDWFQVNKCKDVFATATANIKTEGKMFVNLLKKFGFESCGDTMVRRIK